MTASRFFFSDHMQKELIKKRAILTLPLFSRNLQFPENKVMIWRPAHSKAYKASRVKEIKYLIIIEETGTGFSAYSSDVDGCIATGESKEEVEKLIKEAIEFLIEGMKLEGIEIPQSKSYSQYIEIAA